MKSAITSLFASIGLVLSSMLNWLSTYSLAIGSLTAIITCSVYVYTSLIRKHKHRKNYMDMSKL